MAAKRSFVHAIIYAPTDAKLGHVADLKLHAHVLAILRHDGYIGFPGGGIEDHETWEEALKRELMEEIGFTLADGCAAKVSANLAAVKVSEDQFKQLERDALSAEHFGTEVLGIMRIPLYNNTRGRGLPNFLEHNFIGNAHEEIVGSLIKLGVLDSNFDVKAESW